MCLKFGRKTNSKTAGVYARFSDKDRDDMILDAKGIERKGEEEKPKMYRCGWCHEINPINEKVCLHCGRIVGE